jgi:molecular chaperone GrpE
MTASDDKGAFQADIPANAVEEALRSVEKVAKGAKGEAGAADPGVAVEVEGAPAAALGPADADALAAEVESLKAQVELSTAKGRETMEKLKDTHDRLLRATADLENYKKRAAREREEVQKFGVEKVLKDLLPVMDGLDRALAAAAADDPLVAGVRLVRASFEQALAKHGVVGFSALGQRFDPTLHEALMQIPTGDKPAGTVVLEHARGFKLHERLIRPAMVGVAIEPPAEPPPSPST